jgi:hypothetical protein
MQAKRRKHIDDPRVAAVFRAYPRSVRAKLLALRRLIFDVASNTDGVGELQETLRWGQPSYLTTQTGSGSLIRIDRVTSRPDGYAMYFHCQTTLVGTFKAMFRDDFTFVGNRSIVFEARERVPVAKLRRCIALALTYHLTKKPASANLPPRARARGPASRGPALRRRS